MDDPPESQSRRALLNPLRDGEGDVGPQRDTPTEQQGHPQHHQHQLPSMQNPVHRHGSIPSHSHSHGHACNHSHHPHAFHGHQAHSHTASQTPSTPSTSRPPAPEAASSSSSSKFSVQRRLIIACLLTGGFMSVEIAAGSMSRSLALLTDASHMFLDFFTFFVNLLMACLSEKRGTPVLTYGFRRVEVLTALLSVLTLWAVTVVILYEASQRLLNPVAVDARIMGCTAVVGVVCNLILMCVLGLHSHGLSAHDGTCHGHSHAHGGASADAGCHAHLHDLHDHHHGHHAHSGDGDGACLGNNGEAVEGGGGGTNGFEREEEGAAGAQRAPLLHPSRAPAKGTRGLRPLSSSSRRGGPPVGGAMEMESLAVAAAGRGRTEDFGEAEGRRRLLSRGDGNVTAEPPNGTGVAYEERLREEKHEAEDEDRQPESERQGRAQGASAELLKSTRTALGMSGRASLSSSYRHRRPTCATPTTSSANNSPVSQGRQRRPEHGHGHGLLEEEEEEDSDDHGRNVNLRSALLHAIADFAQNVGTLTAALVIWFDERLVIADPLCTLLFSVLVIYTSVPILSEVLRVLLEGAPAGVDTNEIREALKTVDGVIGVHDLHVWSITVGYPALSVHVVAASVWAAPDVLERVSEVCQQRFKILHTTVQVDFPSLDSDSTPGGSVRRSPACQTPHHRKCHAERPPPRLPLTAFPPPS
mmetsp:Transcript_31009/g.61156  ORF Transcript_31009/g.61156 Transcript_31009/m.61156 type:complete len:700 (+) Transcript_31009:236-2335(+)